ncbi:MAG: hypothetical protein AB1894_10260 [Chloroflexota bacterium]
MKTYLSRSLGILLIAAAVGGLAFSLLGLVSIWRSKPALEANLLSGTKLLNDTLQTSIQGLGLIQASLGEVAGGLGILQGALDTTAQTLQSSQPLVDGITGLMATDLPDMIRATQSSLDSAQESALVIDAVLGALSFLPGVDYHPEKPLNEALREVSTSLDDLPQALTDMEGDLKETSRNLEIAQSDLAEISSSVEQINTSLQDFDGVILSYNTSLITVQKQLQALQTRLPQLVNGLAWGLTAFLLWMAVAQLGLFTQGWELMSKRAEKEADVKPDAPEGTSA